MTPSGNKAESPRIYSPLEQKSLGVVAACPAVLDLPSGRAPHEPIHLPLKAESSECRGEIHLNPHLEAVPLLPRQPRAAASGCVFEAEPSGLAAEQFRLMQRRLVNVRPGGGSVLLTSPGSGDGKSLNAHNLAWALAEARHSTLLLELDLRRPTQAKYFGAQLTTGMTEVLTGASSPAAAVRRLEDIPLYFLGLLEPAANPTGLLRSAALQSLLGWAKRNFLWVVIDAPPILPVADVEELLPGADLVFLVVRERVTPRAMVERAADRLGKRLNYLILNDVAISTAYGYGYEYS